VNKSTRKVLIVKRNDDLVSISGEMILEKRKEGDWYGETELPICTREELAAAADPYQLQAYVVIPEKEE
jgi:hypothetical protein